MFGVVGVVWVVFVLWVLMESLCVGCVRGDVRREDGFAWTACAASAFASMFVNVYGDLRLGWCYVKLEGRCVVIIWLVFYYVLIWVVFCYNARCWRAIRRGMASAAVFEVMLGCDDVMVW